MTELKKGKKYSKLYTKMKILGNYLRHFSALENSPYSLAHETYKF